MHRYSLTRLFVFMTAFLVVLPWNASASDPVPPTIATIEVVGRAAISVKPDVALIAFTVSTNARQASEAVSDNAQQTETLLNALRKVMGPDDKLQTTRFSLQPVYDKNDRLRPSGYRVSNRVTVETIQMGKIGDFIDAAVMSGAGKINNLQFRSSRESEHRSEAAALAVGQARTNAQNLANAAIVSLGRVMRIHYAPHGSPGVFLEKAAVAMSRTPIEIGDLSIEAQVTMVFEIQ